MTPWSFAGLSIFCYANSDATKNGNDLGQAELCTGHNIIILFLLGEAPASPYTR